jgi:hypothetical protein
LRQQDYALSSNEKITQITHSFQTTSISSKQFSASQNSNNSMSSSPTSPQSKSISVNAASVSVQSNNSNSIQLTTKLNSDVKTEQPYNKYNTSSFLPKYNDEELAKCEKFRKIINTNPVNLGKTRNKIIN